ncbi:helix-turn-helix domain-containing protein [Streptomyces sp. 549]|uniref:helix-turn-helix domain-containing protein n=1 Tax=Streptomyces sp. 549 TaxID=3049076 RepID=UPI0024C22DD4|nr:helix-turn-helix domain-containing protein [Streptomyces sp. 549]MDK1473853.1 helix-turn-helix domain-containing protein [Streptomyces sp. 549]
MLTEKLYFNTAEVPAAERFERWREYMAGSLSPMEVHSPHHQDFRAELRVLELGALSVWPASYHALTFDRSASLVRQTDPETCHVFLIVSGGAEAAWGKSGTRYGSDDLLTTVSSAPARVRTGPAAEGALVQSVGVEVPRTAIPLAPRQVDRAVGQRLSGREGVGALLALCLTQLCRNSGYQAADAPRLELILLDLLTAFLARASDTENTQPPETRSRVLRLRIRAFIQENLADPELCPALVAGAHHISVRYLHRLFEGEQEPVAQSIRRQRLAGAHRDLSDPALAAVPVHEIAARWGFRHQAVFTRSFRNTFAVSPSEHRNIAPADSPTPRSTPPTRPEGSPPVSGAATDSAWPCPPPGSGRLEDSASRRAE